MVVFRTFELEYDGIVEAMRDAADKMAETLASGKNLERALYYEGGTLTRLNPDDRP